MVVGSIAAISHALLPEFDAHKFALAVLLDTGNIQDTADGALRAQADAPPVLPPYSHSEAKAYVLAMLSQVSPVREISDEEFEEIKSTNPVVISSRRYTSSRLKLVIVHDLECVLHIKNVLSGVSIA